LLYQTRKYSIWEFKITYVMGTTSLYLGGIRQMVKTNHWWE